MALTLDRYRWTGHAVLMGKHRQMWQSVDDVLNLFAKRTGVARQRYRDFVHAGMESPSDFGGGGLVRSYGGWDNLLAAKKEHEQRIGDERILGESDFVEKALEQDELRLKQQAKIHRAGWTLDRVIARVCRYCEVETADIVRKGRSNALSLAKALIAYFGTASLGLPSHVVAEALYISQPAVSQSSKRGQLYCREHGLELDDL